jgi:hypothetical protein
MPVGDERGRERGRVRRACAGAGGRLLPPPLPPPGAAAGAAFPPPGRDLGPLLPGHLTAPVRNPPSTLSTEARIALFQRRPCPAAALGGGWFWRRAGPRSAARGGLPTGPALSGRDCAPPHPFSRPFVANVAKLHAWAGGRCTETSRAGGGWLPPCSRRPAAAAAGFFRAWKAKGTRRARRGFPASHARSADARGSTLDDSSGRPAWAPRHVRSRAAPEGGPLPLMRRPSPPRSPPSLPLLSLQPSHKTFRVKRVLAKKIKQNRPLPVSVS